VSLFSEHPVEATKTIQKNCNNFSVIGQGDYRKNVHTGDKNANLCAYKQKS